LRREHGQPSVLLVDLGHVRLVAREPDGLVVAEPERCVIPSVKLNRTDLELRPLWELLGDEQETTSAVIPTFCTFPL